MSVRRYKDLIAIRPNPTRILGFHAHNLEVAELTDQLWQALADESSLLAQPEIKHELDQWNDEISDSTSDARETDSDGGSTIKKLSLNIAQICNLKCTYCAAGGDGTYGSTVKKIDLSVAKTQIDHFLRKFHQRRELNPSQENFRERGEVQTELFYIQFLGGEPLLYPAVISELCDYARFKADELSSLSSVRIQLAFSVTTNGTLITPEVANLLANFNFSVVVSFDGDADSNDKARPAKAKNKSSTAMTLAGLNELRHVRQNLRSLKVNSVFGSHNMKIYDAYVDLTSMNINWDEINFLYANNEQDEKNTPLYIEEMNRVAHHAFSNGGLKELAKIKQFATVLSRLAAQTRVHSYCGAGKTFIQSDTRGDLYACNWFMNDPSEKVGAKIEIQKNKLAHYEPSLIQLNKCESCWARHLCGGGCMAVHKSKTGNRHGKDPQFCERTRALAVTAIYYYAESLI